MQEAISEARVLCGICVSLVVSNGISSVPMAKRVESVVGKLRRVDTRPQVNAPSRSQHAEQQKYRRTYRCTQGEQGEEEGRVGGVEVGWSGEETGEADREFEA